MDFIGEKFLYFELNVSPDEYSPDTHSSPLNWKGFFLPQIDIWSVSAANVSEAEFILAAITLTLILRVSGSIALHKPRFKSIPASIEESYSVIVHTGERAKAFYCCWEFKQALLILQTYI